MKLINSHRVHITATNITIRRKIIDDGLILVQEILTHHIWTMITFVKGDTFNPLRHKLKGSLHI